MSTKRLVIPAMLIALAAAAAVAPVASAAAGAERSVTIELATGHAQELKALAHMRHLSPGDRLHRLRQLLPSAATRSRVEQILSAHGLHVTHETAFTVSATGSAVDVRSSFARHLTGRASSGILAPGVVGGLATRVIDSTTLVGALKPALTPTQITGADAQQLYNTTDGTAPAGTTSPAIATLQFSGWDNSDLSTFATDSGVADPVASGQYRAVAIDGASPFLSDGNGGEGEVALDQESLLAAAPHAPQIAYFAPNSAMGEFDALEQVASDALKGHIGALSISWGMCEDDQLPTIDLLDGALADVVAAGVTVFASSGDSGASDCTDFFGTAVQGVDYPASDPLVVGVGGTSVDNSDPSLPVEQVWWDGLNGGGGGISDVWLEPDYQAALPAVASLGGRGVPDIALDGDPASGFSTVISGVRHVVGGTSLASPLAAATFTDLLAAHGIPGGVGDIHYGLYGAPAASFRDITIGDNGLFAAGPGYDEASGLGAPQWQALVPDLVAFITLHVPSYATSRTIGISVTGEPGVAYSGWAAGVGSEPTSCPTATTPTAPTAVTAPGSGPKNVWVVAKIDGVCYIDAATVVVDMTAPAVSPQAALVRANGVAMRFSWAATDAAPSSAIGHYSVKVTHTGSATPDYSSLSTRSTSVTLNGRAGRTYTVAVTATDRAGNVSSRRTAILAVPFDDRAVSFSAHWSRVSATAAFLHTLTQTSTRGAAAKLTSVGRSYAAVVSTCSTCGSITEYVDGHRIRTVSLRTSTRRYVRVLNIKSFGGDGRHTIKLVATGGRVYLDGIRVTS